MLNGFININKSSDWTSFDVVAKLRNILKIKKIGHMGTLDPLASGVLPVAVSKAAKLFDYITNTEKTYQAVFSFGKSTDTLDSQGTVVKTCEHIPDLNDIINILPRFTGKIMQVPPKYSAIKIKGRKACDMARQGVDFEIKPRQIEIYRLNIIEYKEGNLLIEVECSGGTYIRTLCEDMATELKSLAYITKLTRIKSAGFLIENSYTIDEVAEMVKNNDMSFIVSMETALSGYDKVVIPDRYFEKLLNGVKISFDSLDKNNVLIYCKNSFFGIGEIKGGLVGIKTYLYTP